MEDNFLLKSLLVIASLPWSCWNVDQRASLPRSCWKVDQRASLPWSNSLSSCLTHNICPSLKKIGEYYELDKEIVSCYTKMVDTEQEADEATSMEAYTSNKDSI